MITWQHILRFDYLTFLLASCLAAFGLVILYGATQDASGTNYLYSQLSRVLLGIVFLFLLLFIEYRFCIRYAPIFYILGLISLLLCFVPYIGYYNKGAYSWLNIAGLFRLQPSEFVKLATICMLARILSNRKDQWRDLWGVMRPLCIGIIPSFLILLQPDMGTAIVFGPITLIMMFVAGMPLSYFFILFSPLLCLLAISHDIIFILLWFGIMAGIMLMVYIRKIHWSVWMPFIAIGFVLYGLVFFKGETIWEKMPHHAKDRIVAYLNPDYDLRGVNWNIKQSKIALGSGGFWGKGIGEGTQGSFKFLPEPEHDFILPVLGEQTGFLGNVIVLGLFLLLLIRGLDTAMETKTMQGSLVATGIVALFFTHIFINVGMVTGVLPVTGLPLTFISYGGSFMLASMMGVGLLINIRMSTSSELLKDSFSEGRPTMSIPTEIREEF